MTYNSLQGIFTTMIGFVTKNDSTKGGQVTKPIIVVKMPCKLLYVILIKCSTSWSYLILEFLVAYNIVASDWPNTFLTAGCFCLRSITLLLIGLFL